MVRDIKKKYFTPVLFSESGSALHLSVYTDYESMSFCVHNRSENKALALIDFNFSGYDIESEIQDIFNSEQLLDFDFGSVSVCFYSKKFTFVPQPLFSEGVGLSYLRFNHDIGQQESVNYDFVDAFNLVNIYTINSKIRNWFVDKFPNSVFLNFTTVFLDNIRRNYNIDKDSTVFVNINDSHFQVACFSYNKLIHYNDFPYNTPEEYIFFLLYTLNQLKINPHSEHIYFLGLDMSLKNSKVGEITSSYIKHIEKKVPFDTNMIDPALMPVLKSSSYFTLLNQHQCV